MTVGQDSIKRKVKMLQAIVRHMPFTELVVILLGGEEPLRLVIADSLTVQIGRQVMTDVGIRDGDDVEGSLRKLFDHYLVDERLPKLDLFKDTKELW